MAAARRAAVHLVVLQQPLGQSDAPQQVLNEVLNANLPGRLLPGRRLQELLDGDHLPGGEEPGSPACPGGPPLNIFRKAHFPKNIIVGFFP